MVKGESFGETIAYYKQLCFILGYPKTGLAMFQEDDSIAYQKESFFKSIKGLVHFYRISETFVTE
jgi:hypothetical protein